MTREQAERVSELFATVLDMDPSAREAFLRQHYVDDAERNAVWRLLAADRRLNGVWFDPLLDEIASESSQRDLSHRTDRDYVGLVLNGRYTIVEHLGSGGTSLVYLATDATLGAKCVVKVLRESVNGGGFRERFEQEIKALVLLRGYDGIVAVSDAGQTPDGQPYYVMPYVEGATLKSEICQGAMAFERVASAMRQMGAVLTSAHVKGVCHLDLKPSNIFLREIGDGGLHVSLIDFGAARIVSGSPGAAAEVSRLVGTPTYMAPEQFAGRASAKSDQYAMGLIAFEMLTGQLPSEVDFRQLEAIQDGKPGELSYPLPMGTQRVLARALALDPGSRYESAKAFAEEIACSLSSDALWRLWDNTRAFLFRAWSRRSLRRGAIVCLVGLFAYLVIGRLSPSFQKATPSPISAESVVAGSSGANVSTVQAARDRVAELRNDYTVGLRGFRANLYWQCAAAVLGLLLAVRAGAPLKIRSMALTVPVTWMCFVLPAVLVYLWLEFGFLLDDLIKWRAEAWAELSKAGATSRASGFNDGGYLDGWFMAFRPTEHSNDPTFRSSSVLLFYLVYCPPFIIGHACAIVLPYFGALRWLKSSDGEGRDRKVIFKALLCSVVPSGVLIAAHLQFWLGGKNSNWMQPLVGVMVIVLGAFLVFRVRRKGDVGIEAR